MSGNKAWVGRRTFMTGALSLTALAATGSIVRAETVGSSVLSTVSDGTLTMPAGFLTDGLVEDAVNVLRQRGLADEPTLFPECNLALWQDGTNTVLFDTGAGMDFMPTTGRLLDSLDALGLAPEDVTHVLFTHAHPDHLWGVLDDFDEPLFYNARHMMCRTERDFWIAPSTPDLMPPDRLSFVAGAVRRIDVLGDLLEVFEADTEVLPGVQAISTPGHTEGHVAFELRSGSESVLVLGDAIGNDHVSFANPLWELNSDQDRSAAAQTRVMLFDRLVNEQLLTVGFHLPNGGVGRVERLSGNGFRFVQA